jgi:isoleucyl-tRNA synthetase
LYKVLVKFSLAVAPIVPFLSEKIYQTLVVSQLGDKVKESVHLLDYPSVKKLTISQNRVVMSMKEVREVCNLIGSIRNDKSIKVKQALSEAHFIYEERTFDKWELKLIEEEMNIKKLVQVDKFDKEGGNQVKIESNKLQLWLNTEITEELKVEGMVRELSRSIQSERKKKGLDLKATPKLVVLKDPKVFEFVEKSKDELVKNCKLSEVSYSENLEDSEYVISKLMDYDVKFKLL